MIIACGLTWSAAGSLLRQSLYSSCLFIYLEAHGGTTYMYVRNKNNFFNDTTDNHLGELRDPRRQGDGHEERTGICDGSALQTAGGDAMTCGQEEQIWDA